MKTIEEKALEVYPIEDGHTWHQDPHYGNILKILKDKNEEKRIGYIAGLKENEDTLRKAISIIAAHQLLLGTIESWHFDFEISTTVDIVSKTSSIE